MDTAKTHLGTNELHKRHSVMIEGGQVPRAKVMDQHLIDRYLMMGVLDLPQHAAGEYLLGQAARAGMWATGVNLSGMTSRGRPNFVPFGVFPFGRTLSRVEEVCGPRHALVLTKVVIWERDVAEKVKELRWLKEGLDCVSSLRMGFKNPLRHMQQAKKKTAPEGAVSQVGALP